MDEMSSSPLQRSDAVRESGWSQRLPAFLQRAPEALIKQMAMMVLMGVILFPLFFIFNNALKTRDGYLANQLALPTSPTWDNFTAVFQYPRLLSWFGNSILLTSVSVGLCTLIAILAAYAFANLQ